MAESTNYVENIHSVRRKYVDKRLHHKASYVCRANIALLSMFLDNWMEIILANINIPIDSQIIEFFKVFYNYNIINNCSYMKSSKRKTSLEEKVQSILLIDTSKNTKNSLKNSLLFTLIRKKRNKKGSAIVVAKYIKTGILCNIYFNNFKYFKLVFDAQKHMQAIY
jgi:mannitol-specific phosphotransferase system IIBC component